MIFTTAAVVNNFTLYWSLGQCLSQGVSGRSDTAVRMAIANIFVMTVTSTCAWGLMAGIREENQLAELPACSQGCYRCSR